jgi:ribosomal-protein-alanine N-acetyltransferase
MNELPAKVRPMRTADLPFVMAIERVAYSTPWPESSFHGLLDRPDTALFVAEAASPREIAGYAVSWAVADQGELGNIAVAPAWRHRGVGRILLEQVIETMRHWGVRELFLEVRTSNAIAQTLYRQHDFYEVGRRRGYYSSPTEDALVMRRAIES